MEPKINVKKMASKWIKKKGGGKLLINPSKKFSDKLHIDLGMGFNHFWEEENKESFFMF